MARNMKREKELDAIAEVVELQCPEDFEMMTSGMRLLIGRAELRDCGEFKCTVDGVPTWYKVVAA